MSYETKKWVKDTEAWVTTSTPIPLHNCNETEEYPISSKMTAISMMCHNELPEESRSLTGNFFSEEFTYI